MAERAENSFSRRVRAPNMSRLRVLAVAYACNPIKGSESGVGWGWVKAISVDHQVTVITADFNSGDINRYLSQYEGSQENLRFVYVRNRPWHYRPRGLWLRIEESPAKPIMNLAYQDWLRCAFEDAEQEMTASQYDLVHLITYVGWRFPGSFYRLGIPFVWGPIGGLTNTPWRLLSILGLKGALYYGARNIINSLQISLLRGPRRALRSAGHGVIAATSEIQRELWERFGTQSHVICEVGQPEQGIVEPSKRNPEEALRISWSGMHLPGKALHLLLHAAARLPKDVNYRIDILGDGPCNRRWRSLASRLGIADRCIWHGWLPRDESLNVMKDSHVFAITSLKDLTSTVAVEAISFGLPVVCLDHCGFADLVNDACGIKVNPGSLSQIVLDLCGALYALYHDESMRQRLAQGCIRRSRDYSWSSKSTNLEHVYHCVVKGDVQGGGKCQETLL